MESNIITFYTDGAYSSSKKKGGWAFYCPQYRLRVCDSESYTTNNRMEVYAAIKALEFVKESNIPENNIIIISDSYYLIKTMNDQYNTKSNIDLFCRLNELSKMINKNIIWRHIKGHSGHQENEIVDGLANLMSQI